MPAPNTPLKLPAATINSFAAAQQNFHKIEKAFPLASALLADNSVGNAQLQDNSVGNAEMQDDSIGLAEMRDNSIGLAEMRDDSVGSAELIADSVGASELADNSVALANMLDNSVGAVELINGTVNSLKFANPLTVPAQQIKIGDFSDYDYNLSVATATDHSWYKVAAIALPASVYSAAQLDVEYVLAKTNFGHSAEQVRFDYRVSAHRSSAVLNDVNGGQVQGPNSDYVRLVKVSTGNYELQVRSVTDYFNYEVRAHVLSKTPPATLTWYDTLAAATAGIAYYLGGWIAPTLTSPWINLGSGLNPAGYIKEQSGLVRLRGAVGGAAPSTIFTLPVGYRPQYYEILVAYCNTGAARVDVDTAGLVKLTTGSAGWVSLDGLTFSVAA